MVPSSTAQTKRGKPPLPSSSKNGNSLNTSNHNSNDSISLVDGSLTPIPSQSKNKSSRTAMMLGDSDGSIDLCPVPVPPPSSLQGSEKSEPPETGEPNEWHIAIQNEKFSKLETLIKKYDKAYYQRKREQQERRKEQAEQERLEEERFAQEELEREEAERLKQLEEGSQTSSSLTPPPETPKGLRARLSTMRTSPKKSPTPKSRRSRMSRLLSIRKLDPENEIISPMLQRDEQGRTPLHLACGSDELPDKVLMDMILAERLACATYDVNRQYPLHVAVLSEKYTHILEKLIKAHANALKKKDSLGRTPVACAVEAAKRKQQDTFPEDPNDLFKWGTAITEVEQNWQFAQDKSWTKVDFLLKILQHKNKTIIPSEHGLILDALGSGAPPKVIDRFVATSGKYLANDDELAGSAILLCVQREYSLQVLRQLLNVCREKTTIVTDALHKAIVAHYQEGTYAQHADLQAYGKELIAWSKVRPDPDSLGENDNPLEGLSTGCQEWWGKLEQLLLFTAYGRDFRDNLKIKEANLLHAALAIPVTPPSLMQLLMVIHPQARVEVCPVLRALPIHLVCSKWKYDLIRTENDQTMVRMMKQLIQADKAMVWVRYRTRLPLHMALAAGQSWSLVKVLVLGDTTAVGMRDPQTRLFPFQMAAIKRSSSGPATAIRTNYTPAEWRRLDVKEKKAEFDKVENTLDLRQLNTVYKLLRIHPNAVANEVITSVSSKTATLKAAGKVSNHYLTFCYARGRKGWKIVPENLKMLREAVVSARVPKALWKWWDDMVELIQKEYPGDKTSFPEEEDFLLHAALYNPDTPPLIVELLLALFPEAATRCMPGTGNYPLHIAAGTAPYIPQPFEIPSKMDALKLTLLAYRKVVSFKSNGRLPLHIAISRGKKWSEISCLVEEAPRTLLVVDPESDLAPFQLMATLYSSSGLDSAEEVRRFAAQAERNTRYIDWQHTTPEERGQILSGIHKEAQLGILSGVYELLRRGPSALETRLKRVSYMPGSTEQYSTRGLAESMAAFLETGNESFRSPQKLTGPSLTAFLKSGSSARSLLTQNSQRSLMSFRQNSQQSLYRERSTPPPTYVDSNGSTFGGSAASSASEGSLRWNSPGSLVPTNQGNRSPSSLRSKKDRVRLNHVKFPDLESHVE